MKSSIYEILKSEHDDFRKLLDKVQSTTVRGIKTREGSFDRLADEIEAHQLAEEEVFYPALLDRKSSREAALEAYEEHSVAKNLLNELDELAKGDEAWAAKFKVFSEIVHHHFEEEEGNVFTLCRELFSEEEAQDMGHRFSEAKKQIQRRQISRAG